MLVFKSDSFVVKCETEQLHLVCSKKLESDEFKNGLINALNYAQEFEVKHWLFDLRETECLEEEEVKCVFEYFLPKLMTSLGTDNFVSLLLSDMCYQKLLSKVGNSDMRSYNSFIKMNAFCDFEEAVTWLNSQKNKLSV